MLGWNIHPLQLCCAAEQVSLHPLIVPWIIGTEHLVFGPYFGEVLIVVKSFPVEMMVMFSCFCLCSTLALSCDSSFYSSLVVMPTVFLRQSCQFSGEMWCLHITDRQVGQGVSFNLAGKSVCDDTEPLLLLYIIWSKCADLLPYLHWLVILVILMDRLRTSVLYFWFNLEHLFIFYKDTSQFCFPIWMYSEQLAYNYTDENKNIMFFELNVITVNIFHTVWEE